MTDYLCLSDLCQFLLFEWDLSIVADLPQGGPKAPFVSRNTQSRHVLHTLWSDPGDAMHTLCMSQKKKSHLQEFGDDQDRRGGTEEAEKI